MGSHRENYLYLLKSGKKMYLSVGLLNSVFCIGVRLNLNYVLNVPNFIRFCKIIVETKLKIKYKNEVLI